MYKIDETPAPAGDVPPRLIDLGRWMGRRDAFGAIAGRCSAADAECLRQIRDKKAYVDVASSWDEFCRLHLHVCRKTIDKQIRLLNEFGPAYFQLAQLTRITPNDYRAIAPHLTPEGLQVDGAVIALLPENSQQVSEAVAKLKRNGPPADEVEAGDFAGVLRRCKLLVASMKTTSAVLGNKEKDELGEQLLRIETAAKALGVKVF
jgi:hypothetical protein